MSDPQTKLGQIINFAGAGRDAVHIAVAPVTAAETLYPGQRVGFIGPDTERASAVSSGGIKAALGIVDPFLPGAVYEGQQFWMFLLPNTITGLRHEWTHPAFHSHVVPSVDGLPSPPAGSPKAMSEAWLQDFADEFEISYKGLLRAAEEWIESGESEYHVLRFDTPGRAHSDANTFWHHYEVVVGKKVNVDRERTFFTCSC